MGQITANVGSFDKNSANGVTAYGTTVHFTIPANAGITGCSVSFVTHSSGGTTQDRAFALNGARAHSSGSWAQAGTLDHTLLNTGDNTFRVTLKSRAGAACWWNISSIILTITYNDVSGGGGSYIGGVSVNKTYAEITGGDAITVTCPAQGGYWHYVTWQFGSLSGWWSHGWSAGGVMNLTPLPNWAEQIPNAASGVLTINVKVYNTPAEPHNLVSELVFTVTLGAPYWMAPSITSFDAARIVNNTPSSISDYVQNVSGVSLAVSGISGSYGSSIASCVISGGGFSLNGTSGNIGRLPSAGNVDFTAEVTDSRGRKAYKSLNINVLSYGPPAFSNPEAWRSSDAGVKNQKGTYCRLKSSVSYSDLNGQNAVTLKGRVYPKGGTVPAYTSMTPDTPWITGGGLLLVTKTYIAQMEVADLIGSRVIEFTIPTKKTGISIMAGMQGIAFGKSVEIPGAAESAWPIAAPNFYPVGAIYQSTVSTSPATLFGGTWAAIAAGRFLVAAGTDYAAGATGGAATVALTEAQGPVHSHTRILHNGGGALGLNTANGGTGSAGYGYVHGSTGTMSTNSAGSGDAHENRPPYYAVYMWRRTA